MTSFLRRPLPSHLIPFSSPTGRLRLREAEDAGHAEAFFTLIEQFSTQSEPAFCGLSSLVIVFNSFVMDPERVWKGPWRFYSEELLSCCKSLDEIKQKGITMEELACLADCNNADIKCLHADDREMGGIDGFREKLIKCVSAPPPG